MKIFQPGKWSVTNNKANYNIFFLESDGISEKHNVCINPETWRNHIGLNITDNIGNLLPNPSDMSLSRLRPTYIVERDT